MHSTDQFEAECLTDSPRAFYRQDETSGTNCDDKTSNNLDATYTNTPTLNSTVLAVDSQTGGSVDYLGGGAGGAYLAVPSTVFTAADPYTIEWIMTLDTITGTAGQRPASAAGALGSFIYFGIDVAENDAGAFFAYDNAASAWRKIGATNVFAINTTYHVVVTYSGTTVQATVNNSAQTAVTFSGAVNQNGRGLDMYRRFEAGPAGLSLDGRASHLAIYQSALSSTVISRHYVAAIQNAHRARMSAWF